MLKTFLVFVLTLVILAGTFGCAYALITTGHWFVGAVMAVLALTGVKVKLS
jgi:hypothetical protein